MLRKSLAQALKGSCCAQHFLFQDRFQPGLEVDWGHCSVSTDATAALILVKLLCALEYLHKLALPFVSDESINQDLHD